MYKDEQNVQIMVLFMKLILKTCWNNLELIFVHFFHVYFEQIELKRKKRKIDVYDDLLWVRFL